MRQIRSPAIWRGLRVFAGASEAPKTSRYSMGRFWPLTAIEALWITAICRGPLKAFTTKSVRGS